MDMVCAIRVLSLQINPLEVKILSQESNKDPVIATVVHYVKEGWPSKNAEINEEARKFLKLTDSLSVYNRCRIHGQEWSSHKPCNLRSLNFYTLDTLEQNV